MKVRFKNPPINELIIGAYFDPPLLALRSEHIGLLWTRFRNDLPKVEQREPLLMAASGTGPSAIVGNEFPFMPRYWFVSEDEVNLIQVQKEAFLLNWRKRKADYPHFDLHLKPCFDKYFSNFTEFLADEVGISDVGIGLCELTYVNVIEVCEYWQGPQDTPKLIPSFSIPDSGSSASGRSAFNCAFRQDLGSDLQSQIGVRIGENAASPGSPCLILELKALGRPDPEGSTSIDEWYDRAHQMIVAQFLRLTDAGVQRTHWGLEENAE